jgi:hypothetical protein
MNRNLIDLKSIRNDIAEYKMKYPAYNRLLAWLKNNYRKEHFYLTVVEIEELIKKIANFSRIYDELDDIHIIEKMKSLLSENELETLQGHYRHYPIRHSHINQNRVKFWNKLTSLFIVMDSKEIMFCITPDGIVKKSDLEKFFYSKIGTQKSNITLDVLYAELLKSDTTGCDYSEIRKCLCMHYDDLILKRMIWESVKEQLANNKNEIQKTYSN